MYYQTFLGELKKTLMLLLFCEFTCDVFVQGVYYIAGINQIVSTST